LLISTLCRGVAILGICVPLIANAQHATVRTEHVQAELLVHAPQGLEAGKAASLALLLEQKLGWHTYWKNPGDSGLATSLKWSLPAGASAGPIEWPVPERLPLGPLMNYGYTGKLLLPVKLALPAMSSSTLLPIRLHAEWLVCKEVCLPEAGEFSLSLRAGKVYSEHAAAFSQAQSRLPLVAAGVTARARVNENAVSLEVSGLPPTMLGKPVQLFPEESGVFDYAAEHSERWHGKDLTLSVPLSPQRSESPSRLHFVLASADSPGIRLETPIDRGWPADSGVSSVSTPAATAPVQSEPPHITVPPTSFAVVLSMAFVGGLILNLMPCVLPVLTIKVLSFSGHASNRKLLATGGFAYFAGVVAAFVALATLMLALRAAGTQLGWGFQLQSPVFISALAVLFTLIGLNLAGLFEIGSVLPDSVTALRARHPVIDDLLSGVLAVAIASPCTGPFMGAALGASLTQPPGEAIALFAMVGAGMASPYLAASLVPGIARLMPRPGPWMGYFKVIMAFPMLATVVWLLWVLGQQVGTDGVVALVGFLVALAYATWTFSAKAEPTTRFALASSGLIVLAAVAAWAWPALHAPPARAGTASERNWQPWTPAAVIEAQAKGRTVFVDFTAAWCVTCQFNKRVTLADPGLLASFETSNVLLLRADWTRRDPAITEQLTKLGRSGVPVYALYGKQDQTPQLLSEMPSVQEIQTALGKL